MQPSNEPRDWRPGEGSITATSLAMGVALFYCLASGLGFGQLLWESWELGCGLPLTLVLLSAGPAAIALCGGLALFAALRAQAAGGGRGLRRLYAVTSMIFWLALPVALVLSWGALSAIGRRVGPC